MPALAQLHGRIGNGAAAVAAVGKYPLDVLDPALELRVRVTGIGAREPLPDLVALLGELSQVGRDELVLGTEMPVKRHLIRGGGFRDRFDPHGADAVAIEEFPGSSQNAVARRQYGRCGTRGGKHPIGLLTRVLPVSIRGHVTAQ